jgi:hypothetical protein
VFDLELNLIMVAEAVGALASALRDLSGVKAATPTA